MYPSSRGSSSFPRLSYVTASLVHSTLIISLWIQNRDLRVDIHLLVQVSRRCVSETRRAGAGETTRCAWHPTRPVLICAFSFNSPFNVSVSVRLSHSAHGIYLYRTVPTLLFELSPPMSSMEYCGPIATFTRLVGLNGTSSWEKRFGRCKRGGSGRDEAKEMGWLALVRIHVTPRPTTTLEYGSGYIRRQSS